MIDYYLIRGSRTGWDGVVVEEFTLGADFTAVALDCAGWKAGDTLWWSSAEFSVGMRGDPRLRRRMVPTERAKAEAAYAWLGGGELPGEATLRGYFRDRRSLPVVAPLRFGGDGLVYRLLFAKELDEQAVAALRALWQLAPADDPTGRLVGTAGLEIDGRSFTWELRRIGPGLAWCVDVTAPGDGGSPPALGRLLSDLRRDALRQGLIPVTVERLA